MHEEALPSDVFLGIEEFALVKQYSYTKRICKRNTKAMKQLTYIGMFFTPKISLPIYEIEPRLRAVLATGLVPMDILQEVYKVRMQLYDLVLENQKESIFG